MIETGVVISGAGHELTGFEQDENGPDPGESLYGAWIAVGGDVRRAGRDPRPRAGYVRGRRSDMRSVIW
jgi:hypothetical protein